MDKMTEQEVCEALLELVEETEYLDLPDIVEHHQIQDIKEYLRVKARG